MTCQIKIKGFYVKKNWKSYPENWKIGEKLKVLFCDGYAFFFFFVRYSREKVFRKKNLPIVSFQKLEIHDNISPLTELAAIKIRIYSSSIVPRSNGW
jgi:hypothetical protein